MGEQFQPYTSTKKWLITIGAILVACIIAGGVYWLFFHKSPKPTQPAYDPNREQINRLEDQTVPADPLQKVSYFSQLAQHYENVGDKDAALRNYLKAQTAADENHQEQVVFYLPIARLYKDRGDTKNAKLYFEKEIAYLKKFAADHPDIPAGSNSAIMAVEEEAQSL